MSPEHRGRPNGTASVKAERSCQDLHHTPQSGYAVDGLQQAINNAASDWWSQGAALALRQLALGGYFDADMLLDLVGEPPHPAYVGAAFAAAWRSGLIEQVGCRVARDQRLLRVWHGLPRSGDQ
jgi:hypothetical protein